MALKLGELVAFLRADDDQFQKSLKKAKADFKEHGEKLKDTAKVAALAIGVALGAGVAGAINMGQANATLAAQLGATPERAKELGKQAGHLYSSNFGESLDQVNEALKGVYQNIDGANVASSAEVEGLTGKVLNLSNVFGTDLQGTTAAVGQLLRTGLAKDASEALDVLTVGFQSGADKAGDLLDTFTEYGTQFRKLGIDGAQAVGLLTQGLQAGARDADTVADAIKEFSIRAIDGSKTTSDGFKAIGLDAQKMAADIAKGGPTAQAALDLTLDRLRAMKDPVDQAAAATALFGTKAEDLGQALFSLDPSEAVGTLGQVSGAADNMGKTLSESAGAKLESFKRKAQQALVEKMAEAIPTIEKVVGFMERHSAVVGPLITVLGVLAGIIGTIVVATKIWTAVQIALNVAMMLNPIGLIVLGVLLLIGVFILLWVKFEGFRNFWKATWDVIKGAALAVWDFLVAAFQVWWSTFSGFWKGVGTFFVGLWDGIVSGVKSAWTWITDTFDKVVSFVSGLPGRIGHVASGMWNGIKDSFRAAINWIIGKWNNFSLTIGGGSILGVSIPSVRLDTPNIPMLKDGGIVRATPGGRMVGVGEGGQDEAVLPLDRLAAMLGGGRGGTTKVVAETDDDLLSLLFRSVRWKIQNEYGGDLKEAFGGKV